jgi:hypothetical protein
MLVPLSIPKFLIELAAFGTGTSEIGGTVDSFRSEAHHRTMIAKLRRALSCKKSPRPGSSDRRAR